MIQNLRKAWKTVRQLPETLLISFFNRSPVEPTPPSYADAIALFKAEPDRYFTVKRGQQVNWQSLLQPTLGGQYIDDITVIVHRRVIGYVERAHTYDRGASVEIGHFAVVPECVGTGVATIMAHVLKRKLSERYRTKTIIFHEDHPNFSERNYVHFFTKLGALNADPKDPRRWVWDISQTSER